MNKLKFYFITLILIFCLGSYLYFRHFFRTERELPFTFSYLYFFSTLGLLSMAIYVGYKLIKSILKIPAKDPNFILLFIYKTYYKLYQQFEAYEEELFKKFRKKEFKYMFVLRKINQIYDFIYIDYTKLHLNKVIYFYLYLFPRILVTFTLFTDIIIFHKIYYMIYVGYYLFIHFIIIIILYIIKSWVAEIIYEIHKYFDTHVYDLKDEPYPAIRMDMRDFDTCLNELYYPFFIYYKLVIPLYLVVLGYNKIYNVAEENWVKYINLVLQFIMISTWGYVLFKIILNLLS